MRSDKETLQLQVESEARFFDNEYAQTDSQERQNHLVPPAAVSKVTSPTDSLIDAHERAYSLLGALRGKDLLEYAAGDGWNAVCFAKAGARVTAIDISSVGVDVIRKRARSNGVEESVKAEVRNCYDTRYENDSFDIVFGSGILHHLQDADAAGMELARLLKPNGVAVFYEPVRETQIMDRIKAFVLWLRRDIKAAATTEHESPLDTQRIDVLKRHFTVVNKNYFQVLSSASKLISSDKINRLLLWMDYCLIQFVPSFYKLGRLVVIELRGPIKQEMRGGSPEV